ncbi:MAG: transcriptional regulator [Candidatus Lokiarchaeota archaeon]
MGSIDKIIHEPARLMILSLLYVIESADFKFVKGQTNLSWGNLSSHISKLEEAGYVEVEKKVKGKKPITLFKLTPEGRKAFEKYREDMKRFLTE